MINDGIRNGTIGGTICSLLFQSPVDDMLRTMVLATIGAVVSYLVTLVLQRWRKR